MKVDHELKIRSEFLKEIWKGNKKAELRLDDRGFNLGDVVLLKEWKPAKKVFTGRGTYVRITHIVQVGKLIPNSHPWVMFSFEEIVE